SNNIANVGSNGFKKSRAEFGDIYGSTPLQAKSVGVGTMTKSITQQFSQGNLATSSNTLDMAISGQGFFALQAGGNASQTVYTRNGAFNVDDSGYIVDSNGQFLLGYPVDNDGSVSDKTLQGANKLKLDASYGDPKETTSIEMGVNLSSDSPVIAAGTIFDPDDPDTYSATSAVTIFDNAGNPQSATVFYIKTQDPTVDDPTFKYDTKLFVDGLAITPTLTRAVDPQESALFIDKFGNQTTVPQDPAYILEGKGFPLYKADDLGPAIESTPANLQGLGIETFLGQGKTITIVTDPMKFKSTMEYQALQGEENPVAGTFWGKDFLLVDVDNSGPVSIDIPPGTYNGTQLAEAVEVAMRSAFGDDKKVQLSAGVDNTFSLDLKATSGDGLSSGLATGPIVVDLHEASIVATANEAVAGLEMNTFLSHAQMKMTDAMNAYIQGDTPAEVDAAKISALGVDGRMFKKLVGGAGIPGSAIPTGNDIITVRQKEGDGTPDAVDRYVAYSNTNNKPEVKAYDIKTTLSEVADSYGVTNGVPFFTVPQAGFSTEPETVRFMQFGDGTSTWTDFFGTEDIAVSKVEAIEGTTNYKVHLDFDMGNATDIPTILEGDDNTVILGKPSDHIEAYFESTEGLVAGVQEAFYTSKIVVQEIGDSAKRTAAHSTTANTDGNLALSFGTIESTAELSAFGLDNAVLSTNWVDERNPSVKIEYDEKEQRLAFDTVNSALGLGTGIGKTSFTVYSPKLDSGTNGIGIPAFGSNKDISLASDDKSLGNAFLNDGPELQIANKRYGMEVEFDTVNYLFNISSGTTGETLAANSALGVEENQSASSISVGRYKLTDLGGVDPVDDADYAFNKIGNGQNQILGFPREGIVGFTAASGLASKPAVATGIEGLIDMNNAFSITSIGGENSFNVVVDGVSSFIKVPEGNYTGTTLAIALENRINQMKHPVTGMPIGGVNVVYNTTNNNLSFTTGSTGDSSTIKVDGAQRFGLKDVPLGIGETALVRTPVQATDELGRPLYVSPTGEITSRFDDFADNIVEDFYPLYLDDGELTFNKAGELTSPITKISYDGLPNAALTVDFSKATQYAQPFSATDVSQDGFASGRLTNLEIDNYGNVKAGYSNGSNVTLGKIIIANFSNNSGLKQIGNSTFTSTAASGEPELGEAAEDGFGNILSGSLERSNVDITEELVNLITAQRNYQAAAKAMETTTSMTQTIINIRL
ncbi:MAG: flagellar hook-basal body complex protein, partial [Bacteroidetes bacterium]|nr:flagellar hook-basal body complex protein [Bacteroidota bacterium]